MDGQGRNVVSSFIIYYCTRYYYLWQLLNNKLYTSVLCTSTGVLLVGLVVQYCISFNVMSGSLFNCKVRAILVCSERRGVCGQEFQGVSGYEAKLGDPRERKEFQVAWRLTCKLNTELAQYGSSLTSGTIIRNTKGNEHTWGRENKVIFTFVYQTSAVDIEGVLTLSVVTWIGKGANYKK